MRNLLSIEDLTREDIELICERASSFAAVGKREIKKVPTLRGRTIVTLFYESSTRTSSSFELAAKRLSADVVSVKAQGSSVDKGESLKDTIATLTAYDPEAIVIRSPHAGAANLVAGWTDAAVVNAGDGKHEHPSQALLDVYTLLENLDSLDGKKIWIVGDVLHSRVARSCVRAFNLMGAEVTVAGPPTLIPRGFESLGCEVRYTLDEIGEADVVYALRMQQERMSEAFVPSLREYATIYQVGSRRLGPAPAPDAPRPGQPRHRALGRGDRRPELADHRPGPQRPAGADGDPLRDPDRGRAAAAGPQPRPRRPERADERAADRRAGVSARDRRSRLARGDPARLLVRGARVFDPRSGLDEVRDVVVRDGRIAELAAAGAGELPEGAERIEADGLIAMPAFFDPHVHLRTSASRTRRRSRRGPAPRPPAATAASSRWPTPSRRSDEPETIAAMRERGLPRRRGADRLRRHGDAGDAGRGADRDGGAARGRRDRVLRRRPADPLGPGDGAARSSTSTSSAATSSCTRRTRS